MESDLRRELYDIATQLRAYLEVQVDSGATGVPRGSRAPSAPRASTLAPSASVAAPVIAPAITSQIHAAGAEPVSVPVTQSVSTPLAPAAPAREAASPLVRLAELREIVASCTKCALAATRTNTVFARGNPESRVMFLGEAPGADEDAQGIPFVGRAGQLLDKMISAMGLNSERDVYVCNILKCRPPGNRRPEAVEMEQCFPYVHEQIDLVKPDVIVALGNTAVQALLGTTIGITKIRGAWKLYRGKIPVMPTYHPSYLLRPGPQQIEGKKQAWEDLQEVLRKLSLPIPGASRKK